MSGFGLGCQWRSAGRSHATDSLHVGSNTDRQGPEPCPNETEKNKVAAMVFVGDAMEESPDDLAAIARELGTRGVPVFMFQEGDDPEVERAYREIARLSHGAHCRFNAGAAHQLAQLLRAVAAYATGGIKALEARPEAAKLLEQLRHP